MAFDGIFSGSFSIQKITYFITDEMIIGSNDLIFTPWKNRGVFFQGVKIDFHEN